MGLGFNNDGNAILPKLKLFTLDDDVHLRP